MKFLMILTIAVALAVPVVCVQDNQDSAAPSSAAQLKPLPALKLQDFNGKPVAADHFKGSIVVLDFWATWCVPCIAEIPTLNRLQQKYGEKGVKVVGVALQSGEANEVKPFVGSKGMKYTILIGDDDQIYDLNVFAFPTTYLITRDLKVFRMYLGAGPKKAAEIEADIQTLLGTS